MMPRGGVFTQINHPHVLQYKHTVVWELVGLQNIRLKCFSPMMMTAYTPNERIPNRAMGVGKGEIMEGLPPLCLPWP